MAPLSVDDIEVGYEHESHGDCAGYLGFGYLGARSSARQAAADGIWPKDATLASIAAGDRAVIAAANARGWSPERLFTWCNSKDGRWFADMVLGSGDDVDVAVARYVR